MPYTNDDGSDLKPTKKRTRSNAEKRAGARQIIRQVSWLRQTLVYWTGIPEPERKQSKSGYVCISELLSKRLGSVDAGLYAIDLQKPPKASGWNPAIAGATRVNEQLLLQTQTALHRARKFPKELPKHIGNLDGWIKEHQSLIATVTPIVQALDKSDDDLNPVKAEAHVMCVGTGWHPSDDIETSTVIRRMKDPGKDDADLLPLLAMVLGRRGKSHVPKSLFHWAECGRLFCKWPLNVLFHWASQVGPYWLAAIGSAHSALPDPATSEFAREYLMMQSLLNRDTQRADQDEPEGCRIPFEALAHIHAAMDQAFSNGRLELLGRTGRLCAIYPGPTCSLGTAEWLEEINIFVAPLYPKTNAFVAEERTLGKWSGLALWNASDVEALFYAVGNHAKILLDCIDINSETHLVMGKLGEFTKEELDRIFESDLFGILTGRMRFFDKSDIDKSLGIFRWGLASKCGWQEDPLPWLRIFNYFTDRMRKQLIHFAEKIAGISLPRANAVLDSFSSLSDEIAEYKSNRETEYFLREINKFVFKVPAENIYQWCRCLWFAHKEYRENTGAFIDGLIHSKTETPEWDERSGDDISLALRIAGGDPIRFANIMKVPSPIREHPADSLDGWSFAVTMPYLSDSLRSFTSFGELAPRVLKVIQWLALAVRLKLHSSLKAKLNLWIQAGGTHQDGSAVPSSSADMLHILSVCRRMAGHDEPYSQPIRKILDRPNAIKREKRVLEARKKAGTINRVKELRLQKLNAISLSEIERRVQKELLRKLPETLRIAKIEALETLVREVINEQWEKIVTQARPDDDWDNALLIYTEIRKNRPLLRNLLKAEAQGDHTWIERHPENRKFLAKLRSGGKDETAWTRRRALQVETPEGSWTVYTESKPLKVLQMGNLFGTCLSQGDINTFATVANAFEINKKVLYIRNESGHILGRKLLALDPSGTLVGFQSYGQGRREFSLWIKIAFDLLCAEILREGNFAVWDETEGDWWKEGHKKFELIAQWYCDSPEPFDNWIHVLAKMSGLSEEESRHKILDWLESRIPIEDQSFFLREDTQRALIWLGTDGLGLAERLLREDILDYESMAFLRLYSLANRGN